MRVGEGKPLSLRVERKRFLFKACDLGNKVEIEEICIGKSSKIKVVLGVLARVIECLETVMGCLETRSFFRKRRGHDAVTWVQSVENVRGRCCVTAIESFKGRRSVIFIPEGVEGKGWSSVKYVLSSFLSNGLTKGKGKDFEPMGPPPPAPLNLSSTQMINSPVKNLGILTVEETDALFEVNDCVANQRKSGGPLG